MLQDHDEDVSSLLEAVLEGAAGQLQAWPDEGRLAVLCMDVSAPVEALEQSSEQPQLVLGKAEADAGDDGVLPNQQAIAQELLSRVLIMTGMPMNFTCFYNLSVYVDQVLSPP